MKKKLLAALSLALVLVFGAGCGTIGDFGGNGGEGPGGDGGGPSGGDGSVHTITIYRYQTLGLSEGADDDTVKKAIEDKFAADTGIKIDLQVKMYTQTDLPPQVDTNWTRRSADMDGVIHYVSEDYGCATLRYATVSDTVKEFTPLVETYGQNIMKYIRMNDEDHLHEMSCYVREDGEGDFKMNYLVSVETEGKYGLIVRKDYMREVQQYTNLDPDEYDATSSDCKNMTIDQFVGLLQAIKDHLSDRVTRYPLIGAPWDINYTIASAFGADAYSIQQEADGKYAPAQFGPNVAKWYDAIQSWAQKGLWEPESSNVADSTRRSWFASGQAAVYSAEPTVENLIATSRLVRAQDPTAEVMLIAPLADNEGHVNGYSNPYAPDGIIIPEKSNDAEVLVQYIDWLYSDPENYELAALGVKGTHWVEGDDFTVNGNTYKSWRYPDEKVDEYNENSPYNGKFLLLKNINVSNRVRGDYNSTEKKWYDLITKTLPVWHSNTIEGIWIGAAPRKYSTQFNDIDGQYVDEVRSYAWSGQLNGGKTCSEVIAEYIATCHEKDQGYLDWLNETVAAAKAFKTSKFGG